MAFSSKFFSRDRQPCGAGFFIIEAVLYVGIVPGNGKLRRRAIDDKGVRPVVIRPVAGQILKAHMKGIRSVRLKYKLTGMASFRRRCRCVSRAPAPAPGHPHW